jgi:hypothetical protein
MTNYAAKISGVAMLLLAGAAHRRPPGRGVRPDLRQGERHRPPDPEGMAASRARAQVGRQPLLRRQSSPERTLPAAAVAVKADLNDPGRPVIRAARLDKPPSALAVR